MKHRTKTVLQAIKDITVRGEPVNLYTLADETRLTWDEIKTSLSILLNVYRCIEVYDLPDYELRNEGGMFSLGKFRLKEKKNA